MNIVQFLNSSYAETNSIDVPLSTSVKDFVQALEERWSFPESSHLHLGASNYKKTASNELEVTQLFYYEVLCSKEFRNIYINSGGSDYEELISTPASLRTFRDRITIRAFHSNNESLWKLVEVTEIIIKLFMVDKYPLFTQSEEGEFRLCKACYRFYKTTDWRRQYCSIHRENRKERESNLRKIRHLETKIYPKLEIGSQQILGLQSVLLDLVNVYEMYDESIDDFLSLASHLKEELLDGNYLNMIATDRLLAINGKPNLKPGPKRNYEVSEIIKLRFKKIKWKEIEELTGMSRQALSKAISQFQNK